MTFSLGTRSVANLQGVHPKLRDVIVVALSRSSVDFGVPAKAVRTLDEQKALVAQGVSKTLHSKHLVHDDGYGYAADLVPYIDGVYTWDSLDPFYEIAAAMQNAAKAYETPVTWGACWDRLLNEIANVRAAVEDYKSRHIGADFLDFPHFQFGRN